MGPPGAYPRAYPRSATVSPIIWLSSLLLTRTNHTYSLTYQRFSVIPVDFPPLTHTLPPSTSDKGYIIFISPVWQVCDKRGNSKGLGTEPIIILYRGQVDCSYCGDRGIILRYHYSPRFAVLIRQQTPVIPLRIVTLGPFMRGKITPVLHKMRPK